MTTPRLTVHPSQIQTDDPILQSAPMDGENWVVNHSTVTPPKDWVKDDLA
jgi:hypothetical protein